MNRTTPQRRFIFLAPLLLLPLIGEAQAGTYRCNGVVQRRPCEQPFSFDPARSARAALPSSSGGTVRRQSRPSSVASRDVAITEQAFTPVAGGQGLWHGRVRGHGKARLYLQIFRQNVLESTRYMGSVLLAPEDRPVSFHFRSPAPDGRDWSWKVLADIG